MQSLNVGTDNRSTIGSNGQSGNLERFLGCKIVFRPFLLSIESISCCPWA